MADELSPVTREEDYLAAIAGQDVTPPDPATRKEEWLDAIAGRVDGLAEDVGELGDIVPAPAASDSGKVLTAGADGTASWQTAGGGGDSLLIYATGGTSPQTGVITYSTNVSLSEVEGCFNAAGVQIKPIFVFYPHPTESSPYFDYAEYNGEFYMVDNPWNSSRVDIDNYSLNLTAYDSVTIVAQSK